MQNYCPYMKGRQLTIITTSIIISFSISIVMSYILTNNSKLQSNSFCIIYCNYADNNDKYYNIPFLIESQTLDREVIGSTVDAKYDTQLVTLYKTVQMPEIHGFHDIVSTQIDKETNGNLIFTITLDDNPNKNKKYETTYLWLLSSLDPITNKNKIYTVIIPHFGSDSNFINKGWYLAVYDNIDNKYSLPLIRINNMTENRVEIAIDPIFLGDISNFNYTTAVMIRVNDTYLDKQPDYLIDSSPDDNNFWSKWIA